MIRGWHLREGQREVEALSQASEHDERTGREGARCHLAARAFEGAARRALAAEAAVGPVGTGAPVAADAGDAASSLGVQLTVFSYGGGHTAAGGQRPARADSSGPRPSKDSEPSERASSLWARPLSAWPLPAFPVARPRPQGPPPPQPRPLHSLCLAERGLSLFLQRLLLPQGPALPLPAHSTPVRSRLPPHPHSHCSSGPSPAACPPVKRGRHTQV